ncbi:MAG: hypothetical protein RTS72_04315 [Candidatus Thorarchaeota archaeon]
MKKNGEGRVIREKVRIIENHVWVCKEPLARIGITNSDNVHTET